jgi:hypothetical protein
MYPSDEKHVNLTVFLTVDNLKLPYGKLPIIRIIRVIVDMYRGQVRHSVLVTDFKP